MESLAIQIPTITGEQEIEVDVRINGVKKKFHYRIEIFFWEDCSSDSNNRAECIREMVEGYDNSWELVHIGLPTEEFIPITFRQRK